MNDVVEVPTSPEREELIAAGAHPSEVDVDAILAQVREMQAQIDRLNAERGLPSDPVAGAVQNLIHHVKARQDAYPNHDLSTLVKELKELGESPTSKDAERVRNLVADTIEDNALISHDLAYVTRLARDLHSEVLKREAGK